MKKLLKTISLNGLLSVRGTTSPKMYTLIGSLTFLFVCIVVLNAPEVAEEAKAAQASTEKSIPPSALFLLMPMYIIWATTIRRLRDIGGRPVIFAWVSFLFMAVLLFATPVLLAALAGIPSKKVDVDVPSKKVDV